MPGRKNVVAGVLIDLCEQVETGADDEYPDHFIGDEPGHRHVADQQGEQGHHHGSARERVNQAGEGGDAFGGFSGNDQVSARLADAQQQRTDHQCRDQCHDAPTEQHHFGAHAGDIAHLHQGYQHQQQAGQQPRIGLHRQRHRIGNIGQAPGRMFGGQQCAAQSGDQYAGIGQLFQILRQVGQQGGVGQLPGPGKMQQLQGDASGQHRRHHRRQRKGAAPQPACRHSMKAQPRQNPAGEVSTHGPYEQGQDQQGGRDPALSGLPGGPVRGLELLDEGAETLTVLDRKSEQWRPESRAQDTAGLLGHFRFQQAAPNAGNLGDQLGGTYFKRGQGFELAVDLVFLLAEGVSLGSNCRCHLCVLVKRHGPQHVQLRLQLRLARQQRCGQAFNLLNQYLHLVL
ncbi:hypothetical protein D3C84_556540 [compost metagenome]